MRTTWRKVLIEHIDGPVAIDRTGGPRLVAMAACIKRGWIREGSPYQLRKRPELSYITDKGKMALCHELARWAEELLRHRDAAFKRVAHLLAEIERSAQTNELMRLQADALPVGRSRVDASVAQERLVASPCESQESPPPEVKAKKAVLERA